MDEELRAHLDRETEQNLARGLSPADARYAALRAFGGVEQIKERARDDRGFVWLEQLAQDIRQAARQLMRAPGFTATVVLTLALGLGVNTSVFLLVSDFFLRPLAVKEPGELVHVLQKSPRFGFPLNLSFPDFLDFRKAIATDGETDAAMAAAFSDVLAYQQLTVSLGRTDAGAERTWIAAVSDNFFSALGLEPAHGRLFAANEGRVPGADPIIVLTEACWRSRFGGDPRVIGQPATINALTFTIVGVTPTGFHGAQWSDAMSGFVPASMLPVLQPANGGVLDNRGQLAFNVIARQRPEVTLEQAQSAAEVVLARLIATYPEYHAPARAQLLPERWSRPAPKASRFTISIMAVLAIGALLVLGMAVANAANLLFARAVARERELAVRGALGASRWRLLRPLLVEAVLMAILAGAFALVLADWVDAWLRSLLAVLGDIPPLAEHGADWRVFVFTGGMALVAGVLAALWPALRAARQDVLPMLKEASPTPGKSHHRLRSLLVVTQVTLACIVLIAAGLGLRSTRALAGVHPGFRSDHLLLASYDLSLQRYVLRNGLLRAQQFHAEVLDRVARLPGVKSVSLAERVPFDVDPSMAGDVVPQGRRGGDNTRFRLTPVHAVTHTFLETMGIPLASGRDFRASDDRNAPPVAIVTESLARRLWPGEPAIGRRLVINGGAPTEIVGVIRDGRFVALADPSWEAVYLPLAQNFRGGVTLVVRTEGEPLALAQAVERQIRAMEPDLPVYNVRTMEQQIAQSPMALMPLRFGAAVVGMQGLLALVLALTGIYGLVSFHVARRTREIGVRMALGATAANVVRAVAQQGVRLTLTGLALGLPLAYGAILPLKGLLYGTPANDGLVFAGIGSLILMIALLASGIPAWRAARVNPVDTLRAE
ncbi:permease [Opitutus terrae PB90-1]|uniref:Permease n=2 Tax=Opitutus terrae TaxID=107709 RepID=B1ZX28_OPITP|nr:permease [Opitutus terrae PB90-1]